MFNIADCSHRVEEKRQASRSKRGIVRVCKGRDVSGIPRTRVWSMSDAPGKSQGVPSSTSWLPLREVAS